MFAVTISEPGGEYYTRVFDKSEITIGRGSENDLQLPDGNVSTRHATISMRDGKFVVVDNKSTNGIYVNGRLATKPVMVEGPNTIHIAVYAISISPVLPNPTERRQRKAPSTTGVQALEEGPTIDAVSMRELMARHSSKGTGGS